MQPSVFMRKRASRPLTAQDRTEIEPRSASNTASLDVAEVLAVGLQRQRPVAAHLDPVEIVAAERVARRAGRSRAHSSSGSERASASATPAPGSPARSNAASGATWMRQGLEEAVRVARSRRARRPHGRSPSTSSTRLEAAASLESSRANVRDEGEVAGALAVLRARPRSSTRRTASASSPMPALNAKRRPFTRPVEMRRVRPRASASASCSAAATGSRGSPSARGSTLVPPPGMKPSGTSSRSIPFSASLKPPSPEKTTTRVASSTASRASSIGVARPLRPHGAHVRGPHQRALDAATASSLTRLRERVDDQDGPLHRACRIRPGCVPTAERPSGSGPRASLGNRRSPRQAGVA